MTMQPPQYENHYQCAVCGCAWVDVWDCACDDRCPNCDASMEPVESVWIAEPQDVAQDELP